MVSLTSLLGLAAGAAALSCQPIVDFQRHGFETTLQGLPIEYGDIRQLEHRPEGLWFTGNTDVRVNIVPTRGVQSLRMRLTSASNLDLLKLTMGEEQNHVASWVPTYLTDKHIELVFYPSDELVDGIEWRGRSSSYLHGIDLCTVVEEAETAATALNVIEEWVTTTSAVPVVTSVTMTWQHTTTVLVDGTRTISTLFTEYLETVTTTYTEAFVTSDVAVTVSGAVFTEPSEMPTATVTSYDVEEETVTVDAYFYTTTITKPVETITNTETRYTTVLTSMVTTVETEW